MSQILALWDYRRRVDEIYQRVREGGAGEEPWARWVAERNTLFSTHPQTPLDDPEVFEGLPYFPYDPSWRTVGRFSPVEDETRMLDHSGEGATRFVKAGVIEFDLAGHTHALDLLWLDAYGGGIFLPFRDLTSGAETYGGGRYLLDSVKGADLGHEADRIVLDFNYSYHPSCVHSYRWSCPLAPPGNRLDVAVRAGERLAEA